MNKLKEIFEITNRNSIDNYSLLDVGTIFFILFIFSMFLIFNFYFLKIKTVRNLHQSLTIILLPIITFFITIAISTNLALSLGMIGALSIVRFRHPVRSPFELTLFFMQVTAGIISAVNTKHVFVFYFFALLIINFLYLIHFLIRKIFNHHLFEMSFSEIEEASYLEIESKENIEFLANHNCLTNFTLSKFENNNLYNYLFKTKNKETLGNILNEIDKKYENKILSIKKNINL